MDLLLGAVADRLQSECAAALAVALREQYPSDTCKLIERALIDIGVLAQPATIKGWLAGNWPSGRHLMALIRALGPEFRDRVFAPCMDEKAPTEAERLDTIERELRALKRQLRGRVTHDHRSVRQGACVAR